MTFSRGAGFSFGYAGAGKLMRFSLRVEKEFSDREEAALKTNKYT